MRRDRRLGIAVGSRAAEYGQRNAETNFSNKSQHENRVQKGRQKQRWYMLSIHQILHRSNF